MVQTLTGVSQPVAFNLATTAANQAKHVLINEAWARRGEARRRSFMSQPLQSFHSNLMSKFSLPEAARKNPEGGKIKQIYMKRLSYEVSICACRLSSGSHSLNNLIRRRTTTANGLNQCEQEADGFT